MIVYGNAAAVLLMTDRPAVHETAMPSYSSIPFPNAFAFGIAFGIQLASWYYQALLVLLLASSSTTVLKQIPDIGRHFVDLRAIKLFDVL